MRDSFGPFFWVSSNIWALFGLYPAEKAKNWKALQRTPNVLELCKTRSRNFLLQMPKPATSILSYRKESRKPVAMQGLGRDFPIFAVKGRGFSSDLHSRVWERICTVGIGGRSASKRQEEPL